MAEQSPKHVIFISLLVMLAGSLSALLLFMDSGLSPSPPSDNRTVTPQSVLRDTVTIPPPVKPPALKPTRIGWVSLKRLYEESRQAEKRKLADIFFDQQRRQITEEFKTMIGQMSALQRYFESDSLKLKSKNIQRIVVELKTQELTLQVKYDELVNEYKKSAEILDNELEQAISRAITLEAENRKLDMVLRLDMNRNIPMEKGMGGKGGKISALNAGFQWNWAVTNNGRMDITDSVLKRMVGMSEEQQKVNKPPNDARVHSPHKKQVVPQNP